MLATPGYSAIMPRNRFQEILTSLNFNNNDNYIAYGKEGYDPIFHIRPIIDAIVPNFSKVYSVAQELSLDEMTIAFKGKHHLKQYNPKKPDKWGYKVFVLSEAITGYVTEWNMYTGIETPAMTPEGRTLSFTHSIVRELVSPYYNYSHHVYMDRFYSSPAVATEFAKNNTGFCGTVDYRKKGMPDEVQPEVLSLKRGDKPFFMRSGSLLAMAWQDTKRVTMLTTIHNNSTILKKTRTRHNSKGFYKKEIPFCVNQYNQYMCGVDISDLRFKVYLNPHRSAKPFKRVFDALLSVSVINAHIIYCQVKKNGKMNTKRFIQSLVRSFTSAYVQNDPQRRALKRGFSLTSFPDAKPLKGHYLKDSGKKLPCIMCKINRGVEEITSYICGQCDISLCPHPCHKLYHIMLSSDSFVEKVKSESQALLKNKLSKN